MPESCEGANEWRAADCKLGGRRRREDAQLDVLMFFFFFWARAHYLCDACKDFCISFKLLKRTTTHLGEVVQ